jgi:hypothetical protein
MLQNCFICKWQNKFEHLSLIIFWIILKILYHVRTRGHIFSHVWPLYEWAVSDLDRFMHRSLWVWVTHSSFIEGSHTAEKTASGVNVTKLFFCQWQNNLEHLSLAIFLDNLKELYRIRTRCHCYKTASFVNNKISWSIFLSNFSERLKKLYHIKTRCKYYKTFLFVNDQIS